MDVVDTASLLFSFPDDIIILSIRTTTSLCDLPALRATFRTGPWTVRQNSG
jgi:hypothetical protein